MAVKPWDWTGRPDRRDSHDRKWDKDDWRRKRCKLDQLSDQGVSFPRPEGDPHPIDGGQP
jgi:hypothetical protein